MTGTPHVRVVAAHRLGQLDRGFRFVEQAALTRRDAKLLAARPLPIGLQYP